MKHCLACERQFKRITEARPLCGRCEKTSPIAMSAPGLFLKGPAALLAIAAEKAIRMQQ